MTLPERMEPAELSPEIQELGQSLLQALDEADVGVTIVDADNDGELRRLYINRAGAHTLGYSLDEAKRLPPLLTIAAEDRERMQALRLTGAPPTAVACTVIGRDGQRIAVEVRLARTKYGGRPATLAFLSDARQRDRVEMALRESDARFRKLAEAAPDAIIVIERDCFRYANPAAVRALGLANRKAFLELSPAEFLDEEDLAAMQARVARVAAGEQIPPREYRGRRQDGSFVVLEISSIAVEWEGRPAVLAYGRDVTERSRLQRQIAEHDRLAAVGTLAAGVAHEVNNPLTYLMLHLEHLKRVLPELLSGGHAETLAHVNEALDGAERVSTIVRELLELARPREPRKAPTDLTAVCSAAVKLTRPTFEGGASIVQDLGSVPPVWTDAARLTQVLINLLVNAAHAVKDRKPTSVVELRLGATDGYAIIEVLDDGPGIPQEKLKDIFTPFYTTKDGSRENAGVTAGMGLGLSICHSIVDSLGGSIFGENRIPRGASFRIELPLGGEDFVPESMAPSSRPETPLSFKRICVIDDEPNVAKAIAGILESQLQPRLFTNALTALETLSQEAESYEVVLCDVLMPELRGDDLERQLVARRPEYARRFIFMTGAATSDHLQQRSDCGTVLILNKPFGPRQLLHVLRRQEARLRRRGDS